MIGLILAYIVGRSDGRRAEVRDRIATRQRPAYTPEPHPVLTFVVCCCLVVFVVLLLS